MHSRTGHYTHVPLAVQLLSIIFYGAFAISVSIVAINVFWPAGFLLAAIFAYQWGNIPSLNGRGASDDAHDVEDVMPQTDPAVNKSSGNSSFDSYREDLLTRLEEEQENFKSFLQRLRDAQDENEFDAFMTDRATAAKSI